MSTNNISRYLEKEMDPAFARRARIIIKELELSGNEHVLEVGCGRGFYEHMLSYIFPDLYINAIDINNDYLTKARNTVKKDNVSFLQADALHLPWKDNTFDRILSTEVLEHLPDDLTALQEMYRVLKPGGRVVITVPNNNYPLSWDPINWFLERVFDTHIPSNIWWAAGIWADHVRLYTKDTLSSVIKASGFEIEKISFSTHHCMPFSHFILYGIGKNLVEFGFFKDSNRFSSDNRMSLLQRAIKAFLYVKDSRNKESEAKELSTVNIVATLVKT